MELPAAFVVFYGCNTNVRYDEQLSEEYKIEIVVAVFAIEKIFGKAVIDKAQRPP